MTIEKTHIGIVITKDGPKRKKLHATESMWVVGKNEFYHKDTGAGTLPRIRAVGCCSTPSSLSR
ncbi:hypothetical protein STW0522KLE39_27790 [Klebsiella quasipneumoniae]|nr:hypothetical protein STW0522KLE39_27790 [Klebsiella quasipneumoniae]